MREGSSEFMSRLRSRCIHLTVRTRLLKWSLTWRLVSVDVEFLTMLTTPQGCLNVLLAWQLVPQREWEDSRGPGALRTCLLLTSLVFIH